MKTGIGHDFLTRRGELKIGLIVFVLAIVTRLSQLDAGPNYDELYHLLAARSWIDTGTFAIADGEYTRTPIYTMLTAHVLDLTGSREISAARLPNVFFGALLILLAVLWTYRNAGKTAAIVISLLLLFWPSGMYVSQYVRFYALHGLLFFAGAIATYALFLPDKRFWHRITMATLSAVFFWTALQFQLTTLIGVFCLVAWVIAFIVLPVIWRQPSRLVIIGVLAAAGVSVLLWALSLGILQKYWAHYTFSPWAVDTTFYNRVLRDTYPLFWPITPFLAIAALRNTPRPAGFCLVISIVGLIAHTFSGNHNLRYIYYFSPFMFALWAMGVQAVYPAVRTATRSALRDILGPKASQLLVNGILVFAFVFSIISNMAVTKSMSYALGKTRPPFKPNFDVTEARNRLADARDEGAVIVSHNDLFAIEFLDGLDITFSQNWLPGMQEFDIDPRTGKPLIHKLSSLEKVIGCNKRGVFVFLSRWIPRGGYPDFLKTFSTSDITFRIEHTGQIYLFHWETPPTEMPGAGECSEARPR
ncbi:hypothetical protein M3P21_17260 [Ruegeria sp. 2012CJ41-6]|uniref:Glycosyltransferase RgtA/B/C/D-like domain-containing protein n=1 Tax=Ruegeria spongiae TaxID=2942209 RepID=A0ABT0Q5X8_9RHOB|nr:hypothetical protein [Ruegeria spongiae]MCL6285280.1 hypothetical protein [Ruegeria spongiae]